MLVGTAITGQSTSPPTTLGKAPSMPATTTKRIGIAQLGELVQQAVQTGHTHIGHQRHVAVPGQGGDTCLLGHRQVARACRDDHHPAYLAARLGRALDPKGSANRIVLALGENRPQMIRDRRIDPCDQPPLFMLDQCAQDGLDLRRGLALAEDHFGKSAPDTTVQIHLGEAAGINIGLGLEPKRGIGHRHFAGGDRRQICCSSCGSMNLVFLCRIRARQGQPCMTTTFPLYPPAGKPQPI